MTSFILRNDQIRAHMIGEVAKLPVGGDVPMEVVIREYKAKRSLPSNNLYWSWLNELAKYFSEKSLRAANKLGEVSELNKFTKDDMHDLMRHQFLGYQDKMVGHTSIGHQLKTTTGLSVSCMHVYMLQIDIWAAEHGCCLPRPQDSDYEKYRSAST